MQKKHAGLKLRRNTARRSKEGVYWLMLCKHPTFFFKIFVFVFIHTSIIVVCVYKPTQGLARLNHKEDKVMQKFFLIGTLVALLLVPTLALAEGSSHCNGCDAAASAQKRSVLKTGRPSKTNVCFHVLVADTGDSASATISFSNGRKRIITFPKGALERFAGVHRVAQGTLPALCLPQSDLMNAAKVVVIPGSKEGCAILSKKDISRLLRERHIPENDPACLLKSAQCKKHSAFQ